MNINAIFSQTDLRATPCRRAVLEYFQIQKKALSHTDIEKVLLSDYDRVTLYRTLKIFIEKGLLHKVLDDEMGQKYALCQETCENHTYHSHNHVHFKCVKCHNTICLEEMRPIFQFPKNYKVQEINILAQGICQNCNG